MLEKRHGRQALTDYERRNEATREKIHAYDEGCCAGANATIYRFDHDVLGGEDIEMRRDGIRIRDYGADIPLDLPNPYRDMLED